MGVGLVGLVDGVSPGSAPKQQSRAEGMATAGQSRRQDPRRAELWGRTHIRGKLHGIFCPGSVNSCKVNKNKIKGCG